MQYYYAAIAVICLHECNRDSPNVGYNAARFRRDGEVRGISDIPTVPYLRINDLDVVIQQRIATHLGILMGLALSNEHAINALYLPAHILSLCKSWVCALPITI